MAAQFAAADRRTKDGRLDAEEFAAYYSKVRRISQLRLLRGT